MGVWQRQYIQVDNGPQETQQQVLWIQAQQHFVDVRSWPYPEALTARTYNQLHPRQQFDAALLGFAGYFTWEKLDARHYRCRWQHHMTLLPSSFDDASHCTWLTPDTLLETGSYTDADGTLHPFQEQWQRVATSPIQRWQAAGQCVGLQGGDWAALVSDQRTTQDNWPQYEATCWRRICGKWQLQFGTHTSLNALVTLFPSSQTDSSLQTD